MDLPWARSNYPKFRPEKPLAGRVCHIANLHELEETAGLPEATQ
jgi:hypothetical protein